MSSPRIAPSFSGVTVNSNAAKPNRSVSLLGHAGYDTGALIHREQRNVDLRRPEDLKSYINPFYSRFQYQSQL
jgi:hypothetical protein